MRRTGSFWAQICKATPPFWEDLLDLPDGKESDERTALLADAVEDLVKWFDIYGGDPYPVDCLVGPAGSDRFLKAIAGAMFARTGRKCLWTAIGQESTGDNAVMVFTPEQAEMVRDRVALLCYLEIPDAKSVQEMAKAVQLHHGSPVWYVLTVRNASRVTKIDHFQIVPLTAEY